MTDPAAAPRVALVDDDDDLRAATAELLALAGHEVTQFPDAPAALAALDRDFAGVVVSDIRMPGMSGIDLFRELSARDPDLPVILITGHGDVETAVSAIKAGAWDFLTKPFVPDALLAAVARAGAARALSLENRRLRALAEASAAEEIVGDSAAIRRLRAMIPALADADLDVVLEGATGTGKRLFARALHRAGKRSRQRFVAIDCAALPGPAEEQLFDAMGPIARAHRGTLYLANLDAAEARLQHRLARFLEHRAVGLDAREPVAVEARVVAAMAEGGGDAVLPALFHRLAAVSLRLPPLAERGDDTAMLAAHFAERLADQHRRPLPPAAALSALMARRDWPGNVRELEMAVERLVLGVETQATMPAPGASLPDRVRAFERAAILEAIAGAGGEVARVIETLGIPRETFYYRVKRLGIDLKAWRGG